MITGPRSQEACHVMLGYIGKLRRRVQKVEGAGMRQELRPEPFWRTRKTR